MQSPLFVQFGSLIGNQIIDFINNSLYISPNCPFSNTTFRVSNCSSMDIRRKNLHNLSTKSDKHSLKHMVKSEEQIHCDSSALGDDSEFALRYSTYNSPAFQFLMPRRFDLSNAIEQLTTEDTYKTGASELRSYVCKK